MFNPKIKTSALNEMSTAEKAKTHISEGAIVTGDISINSDIIIDGILKGNIHSNGKVIIGEKGAVNGDINGQEASIMGKVTGTIKVKELLILKAGSIVTGNLHTAQLQIETSAQFNGEIQMNQQVTSMTGHKKTKESGNLAIPSQLN